MKAHPLINDRNLRRTWPIALSISALVVIALAVGWPSFGQDTTTSSTVPDALHQRVLALFDELERERAESAFVTLLRGGPLDSRPTQVKQLAEKAQALQNAYGAYQSNEAIASEKIGTDVAVLKYLYKCEDSPVVWYFTFYRAGSSATWNVISVRFDTELELLAL